MRKSTVEVRVVPVELRVGFLEDGTPYGFVAVDTSKERLEFTVFLRTCNEIINENGVGKAEGIHVNAI